MQKFKSWYQEPVGTDDAHLCDMLADVATLVSHVLPDVVGCAHWGAHDAEAMYLDYFEVVRTAQAWGEGCLTRQLQ